MASADLDALFGDGADLGSGVVVKAQLRFRVHPPKHAAGRDVLDRVVAAYDERLDMILGEVAAAVQHADHRRDQPLVLAVESDDGGVAKSAPHAPFRPGSRGGTWYRDAKGNVRYGVPPEGRFTGNAGFDSPIPHLDHIRPRAFLGAYGNDQELTGYLIEHGAAHGFTEGELRFLGAWYGTGEDGGALFDAFLECAGLTRADLKGGVANLRFGSQNLTYEEAVFEFFAAQGALFMGEDPGSGKSQEEWHRVLNDEIKPLLDGVFAKYEEAKDDEVLQQRFSSEPDRQRRRFYDAARRTDEEAQRIADAVVGDWDPRRQFGAAVAGMQELGLIARPARAERAAYIHGRPHLRDAVAMDGRLLGTGPGNPLLGDKDRLGALSAAQLMLLYAAAELHRRWDPHSRSFSAEAQADAGSGDLGEAALAALSGKGAEWDEASDVVRDRLAELVDLLVAKLNRVNASEGLPEKHGPTKRRRSR